MFVKTELFVGLILLRNEKTCQPIVLAVLGALSWIDSTASLKATQLTGPIVRQVSFNVCGKTDNLIICHLTCS